MTIDSRLPAVRGHHLVCMQFSHGRGYSAEFAANMLRVLNHFEAAGASVVSGPDDICVACPRPGGDDGCSVTKAGEAGIEDLDQAALDMLGLKIGDAVTAISLKERVASMARSWAQLACPTCDWRTTCAPMIELAAISR